MSNKTKPLLLVILLATATTNMAQAEQNAHEHHSHHHHHAMTLDRDGMSMNTNTDRLPGDCESVSDDITLEVRVGRQYAKTGQAYGFDQHRWNVPACARVKVRLLNEDEVRHQWMVHGLPRYLYPQGMFHLEANGGTSREGSFIVPSDARTYLVHCDISQHMEKGLKAELLVAGGDGHLPSIPGITRARRPERYGEP